MDANGSGAARLRGVVEDVERIEEQIRELQEQRAAVYKRAKGDGLDAKVIRSIVADRRKDQASLRDFEALKEVYRAALGMLDGTPLGEAARRRFDRLAAPPPAEGAAQDDVAAAMPETVAAPSVVTAEDLLAARAQGAVAAKAGRKVIENPFSADDARRAAWDEGWCAEIGSDGMDIPAAFRRNAPPKPRLRRDDGASGSGVAAS